MLYLSVIARSKGDFPTNHPSGGPINDTLYRKYIPVQVQDNLSTYYIPSRIRDFVFYSNKQFSQSSLPNGIKKIVVNNFSVF